MKTVFTGTLPSGLVLLVLLALLISTPAEAHEVNRLNAAGATFPYPLYARWASDYNQQTGIRINYQSIGSGGGVRQIVARTVDFGATDDPLSAEELAEHGLVQFPMIMGGVVPVVNIRGVAHDSLRMDGEILADIYLGRITRWNDPRLVAANPGVPLPDHPITPIRRSDGSGTTAIFTSYLNRVSAPWREQVGEGKAVSWPVGLGGKGNEGVAAYVRRVNGAIGYIENAFAVHLDMNVVRLKNRDDHYVKAGPESFQAAAAKADWAGTPGFGVALTDQPGKNSWPITGASFILMHRQTNRPAVARTALDFFDWAFEQGHASALALHYVPIPDPVIALVRERWLTEIVDKQGQPVREAQP